MKTGSAFISKNSIEKVPYKNGFNGINGEKGGQWEKGANILKIESIEAFSCASRRLGEVQVEP